MPALPSVPALPLAAGLMLGFVSEQAPLDTTSSSATTGERKLRRILIL